MTIEAKPTEAKTTTARKWRVGLAVSCYYPKISEALVEGAHFALNEENVAITEKRIDGTLELPALIRRWHARDGLHGYVALGCVVRGETRHFDLVVTESAHWLQFLSVSQGILITNGVIAAETMSQAEARSQGGASGRNHGAQAARALLSILESVEQD